MQSFWPVWSRALLQATMGLPLTATLPLSGAAVVMLAPGTAQASVSIAMPFDDLVRESTAVVLATPISESSVWESGRIITYTEMQVDTLVAGALDWHAHPVRIRTRGGIVGHIGQSVEGEASFSMGRANLLFLRAYTSPDQPIVAGLYSVTARAQGQFPVVLDAHQELHVHRSFQVGATMPSQTAPGAVLAADVIHGRTVAEATKLVAAAWGRLHVP